MEKSKIVIIASEGLTTNLLYETLVKGHTVSKVYIEAAEPKSAIIKRRLKKLGVLSTLGQLLFMVLALPFVSNRKNRITTILNEYNLTNKTIPYPLIKNIGSVNSPDLITELQALNPDLIFINGTQILKKRLIEKIACPIVNIHVGITPKYRGVHGGYWAIQNKRPELFGVTLHFVDAGIDTGGIIAQAVLKPHKQDNFKTYPILQYCAGLQLFEAHADAILTANVIPPQPLTTESKLHYHPTIWTYLFK